MQKSGANRRGKILMKKSTPDTDRRAKGTTYVYLEKPMYCANANPERPNTSWRDRVWNLKHSRAAVAEPVFGPDEFSETNTSETYL